ncbi:MULTISPECIES: NUDIX domain-containing protein [unclassified Actinomyces]|uniref:NUDIX domain-containing protein n=1 Tax=unclassified Actinomyces TaxID=2609248 RepID=UPI0020171410|nr:MULTISPECIES: NUDIX domain-containing protein [unclassified Actinomyces]MCL3776712.1 NUDIX domain-containing protein [Actinomyces sp. AC-20-1]MCL3790830.1 NUDIX domain-containing protein [Actinomyces sp. 187325]MCL3793143.1 NUDIX domain-containing protein [Actinomyces sp. 186855]MCL3795582.1 NUDIX domain-containing protein [Actinomyces sp. 217892]
MTSTRTGGPIRVSAVVILDAAGRLLTVRKRGTSRFMFPGGKPEPAETPEHTAVREASGVPLPEDLAPLTVEVVARLRSLRAPLRGAPRPPVLVEAVS